MKVKIFVSFTGLLANLKVGTIVPEELDDAFFAFSCSRSHAFEPHKDECNEVTSIYVRQPETGRQMHEHIKNALVKAERDNRVLWVKDTVGDVPSQVAVRSVFVRLAQEAGLEIIR